MSISNEFLEELNKLIAKRDECAEHMDCIDDDDFDDFFVSQDYQLWSMRKGEVDSDNRCMFDKLDTDDFIEIIQEGLGELI